MVWLDDRISLKFNTFKFKYEFSKTTDVCN